MVRQGNHSLSIFKPANIAPTFYHFFYWIPIFHLLQLWNSSCHLQHKFNCNIHLTFSDTTFYSYINKLQLSTRTIIRTGTHTHQQPTYLPTLPNYLPTLPDYLPTFLGRIAWWLVTCAWKPKVPGSSPAASYVQR